MPGLTSLVNSRPVPRQPPLLVVLDDPQVLWTTIKRMKTQKAIGVDGWYSEELHKLTWTMVVDLTNLLKAMWSHGLTNQQMQARTLLFAKCEKSQNMPHGRPITILGYLVRLTSKLVADQILHQWANTWPPELSGGLPQRSTRDLSLQQLFMPKPTAQPGVVGLWTWLRHSTLFHGE